MAYPDSAQVILNSGCVCSHGCDSCDRLAEAWEAMREALQWLVKVPMPNVQPFLPQMRQAARAALALADKVGRP